MVGITIFYCYSQLHEKIAEKVEKKKIVRNKLRIWLFRVTACVCFLDIGLRIRANFDKKNFI